MTCGYCERDSFIFNFKCDGCKSRHEARDIASSARHAASLKTLEERRSFMGVACRGKGQDYRAKLEAAVKCEREKQREAVGNGG